MLTLNENQWHVHLFFFLLGAWDEFRDRENWSAQQGRTNLCHYIRVMFLYPFLVLFLHVIALCYLVGVMLWWPIHLFGPVNYFAAIAGIVFIVGLIVLFKYLRDSQPYTPSKAPRARRRERAPKLAHQGPGIFKLLWLYLKAGKEKICPLIEIVPSADSPHA